MKNVFLTLVVTLFTFVGFSQDTLYVSGTDTFNVVGSNYVETGVTNTVVDTVISKTDTMGANNALDTKTFTVNGGYSTYVMYYSMTNIGGFNGNLRVSVNNVVDTTIYFNSNNTESSNTDVSESDNVEFYITDNSNAWARLTYNVVNTTVYVEVEEDNQTSVNEVDNKVTFSMYPNPTVNVLNFNFGDFPSQVVFQVFDMGGRMLNQGQMFNNTVDVSELPKGIYVISLNVDGQMMSERFMKQ